MKKYLTLFLTVSLMCTLTMCACGFPALAVDEVSSDTSETSSEPASDFSSVSVSEPVSDVGVSEIIAEAPTSAEIGTETASEPLLDSTEGEYTATLSEGSESLLDGNTEVSSKSLDSSSISSGGIQYIIQREPITKSSVMSALTSDGKPLDVAVTNENANTLATAIVDAQTLADGIVTDYEVSSYAFIPSELVNNYKTVVINGASQYKVWSISPDLGTFYIDLRPDSYYKQWLMFKDYEGNNPGLTYESIICGTYGSSADDVQSYKYRQTTGTSIWDNLTSEPVMWSNYDVYDSDGNLVHEADVTIISTPMVSFVTGFDDLIIEDMSSENFVAPTPTYEGYTFDGWYLDADYTNPYSSDYVFTNDTTLYAKWIKIPVVSFVTGFADYTLDSCLATDFSLPTPVYSGFQFMGWYLDETFETAYTTGYVFIEDTTLYAKWQEIVQGEDGGMGFFSGNVFGALSTILTAEPIFYLVSLMGLALIIGIFKHLITSRL